MLVYGLKSRVIYMLNKLSLVKIGSKKLRLLIYSDWFGSVQFGSVGFDLVFVWIWFRFSFQKFYLCVVLSGVCVKLRKVVGLVTHSGLNG